MSILDRIVGRKSDGNIPTNATFRLTEAGREKLQDYNGEPKYQVMVALETRGTSNIQEVAATSGLSRGQIERLLPKLVAEGYVQRTNPVRATVAEED